MCTRDFPAICFLEGESILREASGTQKAQDHYLPHCRMKDRGCRAYISGGSEKDRQVSQSGKPFRTGSSRETLPKLARGALPPWNPRQAFHSMHLEPRIRLSVRKPSTGSFSDRYLGSAKAVRLATHHGHRPLESIIYSFTSQMYPNRTERM